MVVSLKNVAAKLAFFAAFISTSVNATTIWSTSRQIVNVYPDNAGLIFFVDGDLIGGTCSQTTTRMQILASDSNYEAKVSVVLLAFSGEKPIMVAYDDQTLSSCSVRVDRVQVFR